MLDGYAACFACAAVARGDPGTRLCAYVCSVNATFACPRASETACATTPTHRFTLAYGLAAFAVLGLVCGLPVKGKRPLVFGRRPFSSIRFL